MMISNIPENKATPYPSIIKAHKIIGNNLILRNVATNDAPFIYALRREHSKEKYLSPISSDMEQQIMWLQKYNADNRQAYFIIQDIQSSMIGTVRIYDQQKDSFSWGSWILKEGVKSSYSIESALIVYSYALELGFNQSHFKVQKNNKSVCKFHERWGALRTNESSDEIFYVIKKDAILQASKKHLKFLPNKIKIIRET